MDDEKEREDTMEVTEDEAKDPSGNVEKEDVGESPTRQSLNGENLEAISEEKEEFSAANPSNDDECANEIQATVEDKPGELEPENLLDDVEADEGSPDSEDEEIDVKEEPKDDDIDDADEDEDALEKQVPKSDLDSGQVVRTKNVRQGRSWETQYPDGYESGSEEEQYEFRREVETFYKENGLEFKAPKFYKEDVNLLKLYREVIKHGGYEQVTLCKLWRQVGAHFKPPKTCTTVSFTFRIFYEKALLEYEKHRMRCGELSFPEDSYIPPKHLNCKQWWLLSSSSVVLGLGPMKPLAQTKPSCWWPWRLQGT